MHATGPLIGVLGGMGPLATASFMTHLVRLNDAGCDQDHCRSIVYSNPRIPDRSKAIVEQGPSPLPGLIDGVAALSRYGADVIAIPCNTAHFWLPEMGAATAVPIINIVEAVVLDLRRHGLTSGRVGVLGTRGLLRSGIYRAGLAEFGFEAVEPTEAELADLIEPAIRSVKAGEDPGSDGRVGAAIEAVQRRDVEAVVLGCTELPLCLPRGERPDTVPIIDSTMALASACLVWAQCRMAQEGPTLRTTPRDPHPGSVDFRSLHTWPIRPREFDQCHPKPPSANRWP